MKFRVHNTTWEPVDFDGLVLMRRPLPQTRESSAEAIPLLKAGFSNAAHQQKARQMAKGKSAICVDHQHRALADCYTTHELYTKLNEK